MTNTRETMIRDEETYWGTCRECGHELVPSHDQDGPEDEINLECSILDTQNCVAGEWFPLSEFME